MVPLIITAENNILSNNSIESVMLSSIKGFDLSQFPSAEFIGDTAIAFKGYCGEKVDADVVKKIIERPAQKGIDYSNNIYNFIGIHLADPNTSYDKVSEKFSTLSLKNKYIVTKFFPEIKDDFIKSLYNITTDIQSNLFYKLINLLFFKETLTENDEFLIQKELAQNLNSDAIDIVLYYDFLSKFTKISFKSLNSVELIKSIFSNFQNAIKHLTTRRKDHSPFIISDEYDIQDLSYFVFKSIFPNLQFENPHLKSCGTHSIVDLMIENEGIDIELKMIKEKDVDDSRFVQQIKVDINDYSKWKELKDLIVFIYDPYNKTRDKNNFLELQGRKTNNGTTFNVHVIISN